MKRQIIILTKSDKRAGYCFAGVDRNTGEWIRVVSSNNATENAVPHNDLITDDGTIVDIYDIVEIDFIRPVPTQIQPENHLYNEMIQWRKIGVSNLREVISIHGYDDTRYVFGNEENRLESGEAYCAEGSLLLLRVETSCYNVKSFPERTVLQLNFVYKGTQYSFFKVTDRELKNRYMNVDDGWYPTGTNTFVFSLTDRHVDGRYYKVVAQALT